MALLSVLSAVTQAAFINSALDFGPLNFANNMLNGSSIFGAAGVSIVDGIKVTGVTLLPNGEISIRLRHIITAPGATLNESLPRSVTVTLVRTPMNLQDLTSMLQVITWQTIIIRAILLPTQYNNLVLQWELQILTSLIHCLC